MLIELLREGAGEAPDQPLAITPTSSVTYAECLARAEALARGLVDRGVERAGCLVDDLPDLLALLCGSSAVAVELCLYPATADADTVRQIAADVDHSLVITDRALELGGKPAVAAVDDFIHAGESLPTAPADARVLILTTGTTGRPKAARHDWARLVGAAQRTRARSAGRWLLAYNPGQFAGLQIVLHVLASRGTLVAPRSRQPRDVLRAMSEHGVTHASGTPTFWRMLAGAIDEQAGETLALEQVTLGGEAVPEPLLEKLRRLFPRARMSQVYASTEFGSALSVTDGRSGIPLSALERDEAADVQFRIVDGELQARSRVGMLGYHGEEDAPSSWRATGDLVEVRGDRFYFVGRATETINVGGVKVHPLPVEEAAESVEGVQFARAYGRANPITGQIVVLDVVSQPGADPSQLEQAIRAACEPLQPAARPRRIKFVPEVEIRGDKLSRRAPEAR